MIKYAFFIPFLLSTLCNTLQAIRGIDDYKNYLSPGTTLYSGAKSHPNGVLIANDKIITTQSMGQADWISFENSMPAYRVIHSEKHPKLDLQVLFLDREVTGLNELPAPLVQNAIPSDASIFVAGRRAYHLFPERTLDLNYEHGSFGVLKIQNDPLYRKSKSLNQPECLFTNDGSLSNFICELTDNGSGMLVEKDGKAELIGILATQTKIQSAEIAQLAKESAKPYVLFYNLEHAELKQWISNALSQTHVPSAPMGSFIPNRAKKLLDEDVILIDSNVLLTSEDMHSLYEGEEIISFKNQECTLTKRQKLSNKLSLFFLKEPITDSPIYERIRFISDNWIRDDYSILGDKIILNSKLNAEIDHAILAYSLDTQRPGKSLESLVKSGSHSSEDKAEPKPSIETNIDASDSEEMDYQEVFDKLPETSLSKADIAVPESVTPEYAVIDPNWIVPIAENVTKINFNNKEIASGLPSKNEKYHLNRLNSALEINPVKRARIYNFNDLLGRPLYFLARNKAGNQEFYQFALSQNSYLQVYDNDIQHMLQGIRLEQNADLSTSTNLLYIANDNELELVGVIKFFSNKAAVIAQKTEEIDLAIDQTVLLDSLKPHTPFNPYRISSKYPSVTAQAKIVDINLDPQKEQSAPTIDIEMTPYIVIDSNWIMGFNMNTFFNEVGSPMESNHYHDIQHIGNFQIAKLERPMQDSVVSERLRFSSNTELENKEFYFYFVDPSYEKLGSLRFKLTNLVHEAKTRIVLDLPLDSDLYNGQGIYVKSGNGENRLVGLVEDMEVLDKTLGPNGVTTKVGLTVLWLTSSMNEKIDHILLKGSLSPLQNAGGVPTIDLILHRYPGSTPASMAYDNIILSRNTVLIKGDRKTISFGSDESGKFNIPQQGQSVLNFPDSIKLKQIEKNPITNDWPDIEVPETAFFNQAPDILGNDFHMFAYKDNQPGYFITSFVVPSNATVNESGALLKFKFLGQDALKSEDCTLLPGVFYYKDNEYLLVGFCALEGEVYRFIPFTKLIESDLKLKDTL